MLIRDMFVKDINREINGVIQVAQDTESVVYQEVSEYVVTSELKEHFTKFFKMYNKAFIEPTNGIGVWISGFFGSGKSHFLKMLSYILENKQIGSSRTVDMFRNKLVDSPELFSLIEKATANKTEAILFNIDIEGSVNKNNTAVLRVFAKMFYNHLGFFGENLKVARFEYFLNEDGKTEEFRKVFKAKSGKEWTVARKAFGLQGRYIIPTLMEVFGMDEEAAKAWFRDKEESNFSIAALVEDIKTYIDKKPENFRLLFMIDEMGQYAGSDTDYLLNLQSLVEAIGSTCGNRVWVMCTGQQALDKVIKLRNDEFSRIIARFKTILSLSSASAEEVIQKRVLDKNTDAKEVLVDEYGQKDAVLRNLFTFTSETVANMRGYDNEGEFVNNYPFVPYQFFLLQRVFTELKERGVIGAYQSGAERSMLSGFKEAAEKIQGEDHTRLAPFYLFYDTIKDAIDSPTREIINNCAKAAASGHGLEPQDTDVLKMLYLLRYVNKTVPAKIDNLIVLMADSIDVDKKKLREELNHSLDRLYKQNCIDINGDVYCFLTNEEKDIKIEIENNTHVDDSKVLSTIGKIISDVYKSTKINCGKQNFDFDVKVDDVAVGRTGSNMVLQYITNLYGVSPANMLNCDNKVVVHLGQNNYYDLIEKALKIRTFKNKNNINDMTETMRVIVTNYMLRADKYEEEAREALKKAIETADLYVSGDLTKITGDMKFKLDQSLQKLVGFVYKNYSLLDYQPDTDADIRAIALGTKGTGLGAGFDINKEAADDMRSFLKMRYDLKQPVSVADLQTKYQALPYGWREIDVAAVIAQLMYDQKVILKYSGAVIGTDKSGLPDMLRQKRYTGNVAIAIKMSASETMLRKAYTFLSSFLGRMDVPNDEEGLVKYIQDHFTELQTRYKEYQEEYKNTKYTYPDRELVQDSIKLVNGILSKSSDNLALLQAIIDAQTDLKDMKEDMEDVENFFSNQMAIFNEGVDVWNKLQNDAKQYLYNDSIVKEAYDNLRLYTQIPTTGSFDYARIPEIKGLIAIVTEAHNKLLEAEKTRLIALVEDYKKVYADEVQNHQDICQRDPAIKAKVEKEVKRVADYFEDQKGLFSRATTLWNLEGKDGMLDRNTQNFIWSLRKAATPISKPNPPVGPVPPTPPVKPATIRKTVNKYSDIPKAVIKDEQDIDKFLVELRKVLVDLKNGCDELII